MTTTRIHSFCDDALGDDDATGLVARLRNGEVCEAELTAAAIARANAVDPILSAIESTQRAIAEDAKADHKPKNEAAFSGVPLFIKDNVPVAGFAYRVGSQAFQPKQAKTSGRVAQLMDSLGFSTLGTTRLPEFGLSASTEFGYRDPTRNPWHTHYSTGASSGGSAALVAAGVVPIAHANDGGGSIRIPASCCGVFGLKPSRGRLPTELLSEQLPVKLMAEGIISRSVRDQAYFYQQAEKLLPATRLKPVGEVAGPSNRKYRIGLFTSLSEQQCADDETRNVAHLAAQTLARLGHEIVEISAPIYPRFGDDFVLLWSMMAFGMRKSGPIVFGRGFSAAKLENFTNGLADNYRQNLLHTPLALWRLRRFTAQHQKFISGFDAILSPTLAKPPAPLGYLTPTQSFEEMMDKLHHYTMFTPIQNIAGTPAISIPGGFSAQGLPIGVQLAAAIGDEALLLDLAYQLEAELSVPRIQDPTTTI